MLKVYLYAFLLIIIFQVADLITTNGFVDRLGIEYEGNPLSRWFYNKYDGMIGMVYKFLFIDIPGYALLLSVAFMTDFYLYKKIGRKFICLSGFMLSTILIKIFVLTLNINAWLF